MGRWNQMAPALLLAIAGGALAAPAAGELARLVNTGEMERAWDLAREHRSSLEGDPVFDLYYGIAAIEAGHAHEAVFALRRVLAIRPDLARARVALARAHFETGNDLLARSEFERALADDPPEPMRAAIERYLHALDRRADRYRTSVSGYIELGGGHDSNANSATSIDTVDSLSGTLLIAEQGREQSDDFARLAGTLRIAHPLTPDLGAFATLAGERRYHDSHGEFDIGSTLLRAGLATRGDRVRNTLAVHGQRLQVDGEGFRDMAGLDADVRYAVSDLHIIGMAGRYSQLDYDTLPDRDSDLWELSARTTRLWRVPLRPTASITISYGEERARRDTAEARAGTQRDLHGVSGELRLHPASGWLLSGDVGYRHSSYAGTDPLFGERREDDYYSVKLLLEWRPRPTWRVQLRLTHAANDSNLAFHEHDRDVAEVRLRHDFHH